MWQVLVSQVQSPSQLRQLVTTSTNLHQTVNARPPIETRIKLHILVLSLLLILL